MTNPQPTPSSHSGESLPNLHVGSIWRERDGRFTRFIRVERINCGNIMDPRAQIKTCDEFGRSSNSKTTLAKHSAFGKRYDFVYPASQDKGTSS